MPPLLHWQLVATSACDLHCTGPAILSSLLTTFSRCTILQRGRNDSCTRTPLQDLQTTPLVCVQPANHKGWVVCRVSDCARCACVQAAVWGTSAPGAGAAAVRCARRRARCGTITSTRACGLAPHAWSPPPCLPPPRPRGFPAPPREHPLLCSTCPALCRIGCPAPHTVRPLTCPSLSTTAATVLKAGPGGRPCPFSTVNTVVSLLNTVRRIPLSAFHQCHSAPMYCSRPHSLACSRGTAYLYLQTRMSAAEKCISVWFSGILLAFSIDAIDMLQPWTACCQPGTRLLDTVTLACQQTFKQRWASHTGQH